MASFHENSDRRGVFSLFCFCHARNSRGPPPVSLPLVTPGRHATWCVLGGPGPGARHTPDIGLQQTMWNTFLPDESPSHPLDSLRPGGFPLLLNTANNKNKSTITVDMATGDTRLPSHASVSRHHNVSGEKLLGQSGTDPGRHLGATP